MTKTANNSDVFSHQLLPRSNKLNAYTVVDLFSGAGGMTCGFWQEGFNIVAAVDHQVGKPSEILPCNDTYRMNFGVSPYDFDLQTLSAAEFAADILRLPAGELTVLISCPPCTGYSQKRFQNSSTDDERNALVAKTAPFVEALKPEFLLMENVPEMLRGPFSHHWRQLLQELRRLGYTVWADILDFYDFGLPQRRKRALVVARRGGKPVPNLYERLQSVRRIESVQQALKSVNLPRAVPAGEPTTDPIHSYPRIGERDPRVLQRCLLIRDKGKGRWTGLRLAELTSYERELLTGRIRSALEKGDTKTYPDCYGTMDPKKVSPTVVRQCGDIGTGPWFHWSEPRMLTAREMSIIQGFPYIPSADGLPFYRFAGPLSKVYQQIGNAVPPLVSRIIAQEILALLDGKRGLHSTEIPKQPWL